MNENEQKLKDSQLIKQKIRERYKGVSEDVLDVIPAAPQEDFYKPETKKRVAVYARVSTDDPNQTSSYELQKNHYEDMVNEKPNWDLVGIYADEGISGTSLQHRDNFLLLLQICKEGKVDIIITKSVSRFARNIVDSISQVREEYNEFVPNVHFELIPIKDLVSNQEYQRSSL